jgi:mannonate dehydratase
MRFDLTDFAAFDLHLLLRDGAEADYPDDLRERAADPGRRARRRHVRGAGREHHRRAAGVDGKLDAGRCARLPRRLRGMGADDLRRNLIDFLKEVVPVAEELGLRLCCHPDDPPFPLLGLPRVMSTLNDYETVLEAVPSPANGATFCTGSLGVRADFDPVAFVGASGRASTSSTCATRPAMRTRTVCASVSRKARIWRAIRTWWRRSAR